MRKMKSPMATVGYNAKASQGYQPVSSFDSMLESGPLIRPASSSQEEESEEEDSSSPPEEDLHGLLVKAWEAKVFPVIQRRFRNDQERKSGLEQIKGALQLGMEGIAQETVEFLYEENGGIPKDLHLPTMDDVKAELGKFTIGRVRKGSAVVVQREFPYARCGVRTMQRTQGLTGIVLDVDESNELVQVECYLQSEGALVRFWYPVVYLERPPPGYRKSPTLRGIDAANMLVHRELLLCEGSLASLFGRRCLLSLSQALTPGLEPSMDHLRMLAAECFSEPLPEGTSTTTCPSLSPSPSSALHALSLSPLVAFFSDAERVEREIASVLFSLSDQLEGLARCLCGCLQAAPQDFGYLEIKITEAKESVDVGFPSAAFMVVACINEKPGDSVPPSSTYKYPWARVLCYRSGQARGGKQQLQEVCRYPNELAPSSSAQYCGPAHPSLVLPFSRVHVKYGGCSTKPGRMLVLLAIPADFPLALAFTHVLSRQVASGDRDAAAACSGASLKALSVCAESLVKVLSRLDCSPPIKELVFHELSNVLSTLSAFVDPPSPEGGLVPYTLPSEFVQLIRQELLKLYEVEANSFAPGKDKGASTAVVPFPPPGSVGDHGSGKFSTYFQALLHFALAISDYQLKFNGMSTILSVAGATPNPAPSSGSGTSTILLVAGATLSHALSAGSEPAKKAVKRTRIRKGNKKEGAGSGGSGSGAKKESWLCTVRAATSLLRDVATMTTDKDIASSCPPAISHETREVGVALSLPAHPNARLIVVTGINRKLAAEAAQRTLRAVTRSHGGLYREQLYLPVEEAGREATPPLQDEGAGSSVEAGKLETSVDGPSGAAESSEPQVAGQDGEPSAPPPPPVEPDVSSATPPTQDHTPVDTPPTQDHTSDMPPATQDDAPAATPPTHPCGGAVLELCCGQKVSSVSTALLSTPGLQPEGGGLSVCSVGDAMSCGEEEAEANRVLGEFLVVKLICDGELSPSCQRTLSEIFTSSLPGPEETEVALAQVSGLLNLFLVGYMGGECSPEQLMELAELICGGFGTPKEKDGRGGRLDLHGFLRWARKEVGLTGARVVWQGLFACGYDLHFERCGFLPSELPPSLPSLAQQCAVVGYVDGLCRHLAVSSASLQPWDIALSEASLSSQLLAPLQGLSLAEVRLCFLHLKHVNRQLSLLLPALDLRSSHPLSPSSQLSRLSPLLFYDVKISFLHAVLNASTRRSLEQPPPEIKMDPLEAISGVTSVALETQFCKAAAQMLGVPSAKLCVPLASGGDPTYAFNVKLAGEEVHGTSGSFRHFLWQVVRELQSTSLPILLPCPSGAAGVNTGKCILAPGLMSYSEEKLLQFFGQLLGVAVRADVPVALDLLPSFWKSLGGQRLSLTDLREADCLMFNLTQRMLDCSGVEEFEELLSGLVHSRGDEVEGGVAQLPQGGDLQFVFAGLSGEEAELCPGGRDKTVTYDNRTVFVHLVRELRLKELSCELRMEVIRCGLASVLPHQLLKVLTPQDLDLRVCGLPDIDLEYLKRHTMYQVGLMESDAHVQYFWTALDSFSQDELRKFIKFACNQERIPFGLPCREDREDMHVPPYPMKIAPPDGKGPPDSRYIRAETCMFMIKLPQYSAQEIMTERLRYAVHCREDPLSG